MERLDDRQTDPNYSVRFNSFQKDNLKLGLVRKETNMYNYSIDEYLKFDEKKVIKLNNSI